MCVFTNSGEFVGQCSMMQQQVDDVCVSLLCSLMERAVTVLQGEVKRGKG